MSKPVIVLLLAIAVAIALTSAGWKWHSPHKSGHADGTYLIAGWSWDRAEAGMAE